MLLKTATAIDQIQAMLECYITRLSLPTEQLCVTTERQVYHEWRGKLPSSRCAGCYSPPYGNRSTHVIYLNLGKCADLEVVIAEECLHMRDWLHAQATGTPMRGHRKHGHDAIAHEVAVLTGRSLAAVRRAARAPERQPYRYIYACPACNRKVYRRHKGRWSCGHCDPQFNPAYLLVLKTTLNPKVSVELPEQISKSLYLCV